MKATIGNKGSLAIKETLPLYKTRGANEDELIKMNLLTLRHNRMLEYLENHPLVKKVTLAPLKIQTTSTNF